MVLKVFDSVRPFERRRLLRIAHDVPVRLDELDIIPLGILSYWIIRLFFDDGTKPVKWPLRYVTTFREAIERPTFHRSIFWLT